MVGAGACGYRDLVRCPYCQADDDKVVDSRPADEGSAVRRRRECLACGRRFTTQERVVELPLMVVKRSGLKEPFERAKLSAGIDRAVAGSAVDPSEVEALAAGIEEEARAAGPEVTSQRLGLAVLERLRTLDPVSYLRFASVYKGFEAVADFEREVGEMNELSKTTAPKRRRISRRP
jgi:transcriptional repressor NrdR